MPSSVKCAWRVAAQLGIIATGLPAAWQGASMIFTSKMVESPPSPCAPMPSALTLSKISMRMASMSFFGPRALRGPISMGSINACFASNTQCSAVPPMPIPNMPGGHQPAPICGSISTTQSIMLSEGFIILNFDLFSLPPPLAATSTDTLEPGTRSTCKTHGVLSLVLRRVNAGSSSTEARSLFSGCK